MNKLTYTIMIHAQREKVWNVLWNDTSYREWAQVFSVGCHAVSDWEEGSRVMFLSGNGEGMFSVIEKKINNEFMSFRHLGLVKNEKEQPIDEDSKKWSGAMEEYTLSEKDGQTELKVEIDTAEDIENYFNETFPKALAKIKSLSEH